MTEHGIGIWLPILECNQFGVREPPVPPPVLVLYFEAEAAFLAAPGLAEGHGVVVGLGVFHCAVTILIY